MVRQQRGRFQHLKRLQQFNGAVWRYVAMKDYQESARAIQPDALTVPRLQLSRPQYVHASQVWRAGKRNHQGRIGNVIQNAGAAPR